MTATGAATAIGAMSSAPEERQGLLVLGLGNVLCSDDGVGPAAVAALLRRYRPPAAADVLDGGTLGLSLLPCLESARDVILVDAVQEEGPPGTLVELTGEDVPLAVRERLSAHQIGVADLLHGARWRGRSPERLLLLGLVPETLVPGLGLSPAVGAALPALVTLITTRAAALGYPFRPATDHEASECDPGLRAARVLEL
jgi:hydrogenase maturation protease